MSSNSSNSTNQTVKQTHRFVRCEEKTGIECQRLITFDARYKSTTNKFIPLEEVSNSLGQKTLKPHDCPVKKQQQPQPQSQQTQQQPPQQQQHSDLSKEVMTIKE